MTADPILAHAVDILTSSGGMRGASAALAERAVVARHTVKTQAISVYRKLRVTSRGQAVKRLQDSAYWARRPRSITRSG
jgi:hypothetical protein